MRLKVINPNTSAAMTSSIGRIAATHAAPGTEIVATCPAHGPESIESYYDEYLAIPHVLAEVEKDEAEFDGFVLACWGDPGVDAVREVTLKPVVGIAEASMYAANAIAPRWSVVTTLQRSHHMVEAIVKKTGLSDRCASIRCVDLPVLDCESDPEAIVEGLAKMGHLALTLDGAEAIILGCAGMGGLDRQLTQRLGVPCIDAVAAGVRFAEMLVGMKLQTSKWLTYRYPEPKSRM
ncbi:aspartate/glutamate racemase family protein [Oscillatoria sp. FACHB-1407]|uniref:aspartate/glutamate racemase family protein n=1 Tax=Oscillatoria sp. FACHB-1407 TaxID=2692847 RepID=UPI00168951E5|nr:aspartate/glutamate racemase family protein [Oscillatoria sp. FACHB-1407]MBD2463220.1 aspartate/glutamate racemase family protein [Oscillatoria sp. FACHB-1407]